MISVRNDTPESITVTYCTDPEHPADCAGEITQTISPGGIFTYDQAADNGPTITAQLAAATDVTP